MISRSVYSTDVRVRKEAETLAQAGHQVDVIGLGPDQVVSEGITVHGIGEVHGITGRRPSSTGAAFRLARWALLPTHRRAAIRQFGSSVWTRLRDLGMKPDVVHAHDFPALHVGHRIANETGARLVYDAHELWTGMSRGGRPSPFIRLSDLRREGAIARGADAVITVSPGAARYLQAWHGLEKVWVVRNTFAPVVSAHPPDVPRGIVYAGRISKGRDLETLFSAAEMSPSFALHLIGPADGTVTVPASIHVHPSADLDRVESLIGSQGIAAVPLERGPLNHEVALPNKLFEAVALGIPVMAADLPEIAAIVTEHRIGHLYQPGDSHSARAAIENIRSDYDTLLNNVADARLLLSWSKDGAVLTSLYGSLE